MGGVASAAGVLLGGLLTEGLGWRWVMFVNPIACVLVLIAVYRLIDGERRHASLANFDALGATLATGGMLLLVYALVQAPTVGWATAQTIGELAERSPCWPPSWSTSCASAIRSCPCRSSRSTGWGSPTQRS